MKTKIRSFTDLRTRKVKQLITRAVQYLKGRPLLNSVIWAALIVGFIFFIFVWVPYKQNERQIKFLEQQATQTKNGLQEFKNLFSIVTSKPRSLNQAGIAYYLRNQTEATTRMLEMINDISPAISQEKEKINQLPALIFYPDFSNKIKSSLNFEISIDKEQLDELKKILQTQKTISQALLNLMVFDPNTFFDKPLPLYEKNELSKKIITLNESIGKTENSLDNLEKQSTNQKISMAKNLIKSQHSKVISILNSVNQGNLTKAEKMKNELAYSLTITQKNLGKQNSYLLYQEIDEEHLKLINELIEKHDMMLNKINEIQDKYF